MTLFLKKKIFLTRSEEDNFKFKKCFNSMKHNLDANEIFVSVPLLNICFKNIKNLSIQEKNLIFTSRYGIKALSKIEDIKQKRTYCVGKSTAEFAINSGLKNVIFPKEGNVRSLINLISKQANDETFHYIRGQKVSYDLKKEITNLGYKINETIIYKQENHLLSEYNKNLISGGKVYGIIFFSSQVVKLFCKDIKKVPDGFVFFCISDRVAENLIKSKILGKYKIKIAKKPNQEHIIDLICKEKLLSF